MLKKKLDDLINALEAILAILKGAKKLGGVIQKSLKKAKKSPP